MREHHFFFVGREKPDIDFVPCVCLCVCRATHEKVSAKVDGLLTLPSSTETHELQLLYSDLVSLKTKLGMELEALTRSSMVKRCSFSLLLGSSLK